MLIRSFCAAVLTLATACSALAQTYTMKTFAGGVLPGGAPGLSASLGGIYGVAVDRSGNVFLALGDYDMVLRMDVFTGLLTRVAGNGTRGYGGDNGPATSAQLSGPTGLAVDGTGNLYIADSGNCRIRKVANGAITTVAGNGTPGYTGDNGPATDAQFDGLVDIALDPAGNLYVADFYNQVVRRVSNGVVSTVAGDGTYGYGGDKGLATKAQLAGPAGIALDSGGSLYIADAYNNRVRKVTNGVITTVAGTGAANFTGDKGPASAATLRQPTGVALDSAGNLYVADWGNNRVRMISASNSTITTLAGNGTTNTTDDLTSATGTGLTSPQHLVMDSAGDLYVVDGNRLRLVVNGGIVTIAGRGAPMGEGGPPEGAQLLSPQALAWSGGGLYLTDEGTGRVLKVSGGVLTRAAGTGSQGFSGDGGPATSAQLNAPSGVALDPAGAVYVSDSQNLRVRRIANGAISTVVGGGSAFGDDGPATSAQLRAPRGIVLDGLGSLFIADLNRVRAVVNGVIKTVVGTGAAGYQGDNGPATAAMVSNPSGVAMDSQGALYVADTLNNRVRKVSGGVITTVAGNGNYGSTGSNGAATSATLGAPAGVAADSSGNLYITDAYRVLKVSQGKISTIGGLSGPQGVAVDADGNVYVAEPAAHRVVVLTPAGTSCSVTVTPASRPSPAAGGSVSFNVQTGASCPWTVEALPSWIAVSGSAFGAGPSSVTLDVAPNPDSPRSAAILIGGQSVTVTQAGVETIAGQVTLRGASPLPGVAIALSGARSASALSDSGGYFSFSNLDSTGSYTVTPTLAGYSFVPASQTFSNVTANPTANFAAWPPPRITGAGPAFGGLLQPVPTTYAPGEIMTIYGAELCGDAASATPTLPDRLAGCIVQVDGAAVRLYYASPVQINLVLPQAIAVGTHQLVVLRYTDTGYKTLAAQSPALAFTVDKIAMAFVERTEGAVRLLLAQYLDGGFSGPARPLHPGDIVVLYLTGIGRKAATFAEGAAPKVASKALESIQVLAQGQAAQVLYAGVQPQFPGLDQVNVQLPKYTLPAGKTTVTLEIAAASTGQVLRYEIDSF